MDNSEILVHISAPSGVLDDARYCAQVKAILNFQAHSRESITLRADEHQHQRDKACPSTSLVPQNETIGADPSPSAPVLSNPLHQSPGRQDLQDDSLEAPISCIPDSQPPVPTGFVTGSLSLLPQAPAHYPTLPSKRPRAGSPLPPGSPHQHNDGQADGAGDCTAIPTHAAVGLTTDSPSAPIQMAVNLGKEKEKQAKPGPNEEQPTLSIPLVIPLQIKPPPPPISQSQFKTHVTPTLEMLTKRLKSKRTYTPITQTRILNPLERGYWYLRLVLQSPTLEVEKTVPESTLSTSVSHPTYWDIASFTKFWTFLTDFISKEGRAGWGVWCILEDENSSYEPDADTGASTKLAQATMAQPLSQSVSLKVYSWGEIACHIYLLLFLASDRRVRKMGAQWRDAREEVVIQMP